MKRLSLFLVMIITACLSLATIEEFYTFNETNGTYTPITGTVVSGISSNDAISGAIPIGFIFPYGDNVYTEVKISSNGWIGLGNSQANAIPINNLASMTVVPVFAPLWDDCSLSSGFCQYLLSGIEPNRIFTIQYSNMKWNYGSTTLFNFQVKLYENGKIDFIYGTSTGSPNSPSASIGINMLPGGSSWFYSITPGTPAVFSTTVSNNSVNTFPSEGTIYEFNPIVAAPNDLAALSVMGNITPTVGESSNYTITIRNLGSNPQSTYRVKLLMGNQEIGSATGNIIQPEEIQTYTLPWTPTTAGPATLYGKVVLASDENLINDQTPPLDVVVQPGGINVITVGSGDELARIPMDFNYKSSLFECLFYPDELGFVSGTIYSLAFYNNFADSPANGNTKIWLGSTTQSNLSSGWIRSTQLTLVFDGNIIYPSGMNNILVPLQTPYTHTSGNLVMMVQRPLDNQYYSSSDFFYAQTVGNNRARKAQSDSVDYNPANPQEWGTISGLFPKTTFFHTGHVILNDLACLSINGNTFPTVGNSYNYIITIKNRGTAVQNDYTIKLMKEGGIELNFIAGPAINPLETLQVNLTWMPTTTDSTYLYGVVDFTDDEISENNQSPNLQVVIQPIGIQAVTIGTGDQLERIPMDFWWRNSLFECLFYPDEIGFVSGTIYSLAFYNNFAHSPANGSTKIWLGTTNQEDLSAGWVPSTQMTLVFDGNVNYPAGNNIITIQLQTPYMHIPGNLVMMVQRPMDIQYYTSSDYFQAQTVGTNRARKIYSDNIPYDPANPHPDATVSGQFPKTTIFFSEQVIVNDLGCLNISGNTTPSVGAPIAYTIRVRNNGTSAQTDYTVNLMKEGGILLGSVPGVIINSLETLDFTINWTPTETGAFSIYGEIEMTGDEIVNNNQTHYLNITVYSEGTLAVTVGTGTNTGRMPIDFYYKNSLFETIYLASELNISGLLTDIQFYNNFYTNIPNEPTNIWIGETTQTDLSAGWIPSTQLTQVFSGYADYPQGQNDIPIHLTTPYSYGGGNLVVMVERPRDTNWFSSYDVFRTQTGTVSNRTRNVYSDSVDYDPANPPTITPTAMFPMTTFMLMTEGLGAINGTVYTTGNVPVEGATVTVAEINLICTTGADGTFTFPYIPIGAYQITATKHGYIEVTNTVTVIEDETLTSDFVIIPLPQVMITGRIVGSDQPMLGLADATIILSGYDSYQAITDASGQFTITNVYAYHTYDYIVYVTCYQQTTGTVEIGSTDVNMGDIVVNELAFPTYNVFATEVPGGPYVNLAWMEPNPSVLAEWIHYDSGLNYTSIGTGSAADFDVAIRFPPSALQDYAGMSLYAVKVWPAQAGTFSIRVWTGGNAFAPATMVIDQPFTPNLLDAYHTVILANPVLILGDEELWFGYRCNVTGGYPAGCDSGPAVDGFGNMMYSDGIWTTTLEQNPNLNYNWNIQGYVGYSVPDRAPEISLSLPSSYVISDGGMRSVTAGALTTNPDNAKLHQGSRTNNDYAPQLLTVKEADKNRYGSFGTVKVREEQNTYDLINNRRNNRAMSGYKVWRLLQGQETNESSWTLLTTDVITATAYQDNGWGSVPDGMYKWAVKVVYTGGIMSNPAFSNALPKVTEIGTIAGTVKNQQNAPIMGATVSCGNVTTTTNSVGAYSMLVPTGIHNVTASAPGYDSVTHDNVVVVTGLTTTVNFILPPSSTIIILEDSFEAYENFALTFAPWTCVDVDLSATYGISGVSFPNCYAPMAYIIFVPSATAPPLTATDVTHTGTKIAASFAATSPPNNDWLITPVLHRPTQITFWARSYVTTYGMERFKVGVSTTGTNPSNFTIISGPNYIEAPAVWTEYTYVIDGQPENAYIGIQCVSNDAFIFLLDDVTVEATPLEDPTVPVLATELQGNYPNPFNPETTIRYSVKETVPVTIEVYNLKGQLVRTLVNEVKTAGNYSVVWNGRDSHNQPVSSGVYFYKMNAGKYSNTKKMIMMK